MPKRNKPRLKAEDLYRLQLPRSPKISPDGEHVIFSITRADRATEEKFANLWLVPTRRGAPRQFTYGDQSDSAPEWSPDGTQIAFLSNRGQKKGESPQLHIIPFSGGEARPTGKIDGAIAGISWAPDGKKILCTVRKRDAEELLREKDPQKNMLGTVARHYDRVFYKSDGVGYLPRERWHLWIIDVKSGKASQLTDHKIYDEVNPAWSPDGNQIVFVSIRSNNPDIDLYKADLYVMPAIGGEMKAMNTPEGNKTMPVFSPDGKWIAYYGREDGREWWKNLNLWLVPVDGAGPATNLTQQYDLHINANTLNDQGGQELPPPTWSPDSQRIYFTIDRHGSTILQSVDIQGGDRQTHVGPGGAVGSFTLDKAGGRCAYFQATIRDPGQIFTQQLDNGKTRQLTYLNPWLRRIDLGEVEELWFKGGDGNDLQGWIMKPPGFDPEKSYPSIMEIHGGPLLQYGNFFMHEFYFLAANGYVVYFCNPRGGQGYGEAHSSAIWGRWGTVDYDDLMKFSLLVARKSFIDKKRRGVTGGSYGGYMTLWIIGHTQRFTAAVAQRVVSNFTSMWGSSDLNWVFQMVIGDKPPYEDVLNAWDRSPIKYIGNARTPTLIIHSEQDHRTPIEQGEQAYTALKQLGVDTEFVRFPGEPHGLSRAGRTDRRVARLNHILRWFEKYLK